MLLFHVMSEQNQTANKHKSYNDTLPTLSPEPKQSSKYENITAV